jgi:uncharacterized protein YjdB
VRAEGNGNPCTVTEEEAIDSVIEEYSDVTVAADATGTATITVTATKGSDTATATCVITVSD